MKGKRTTAVWRRRYYPRVENEGMEGGKDNLEREVVRVAAMPCEGRGLMRWQGR